MSMLNALLGPFPDGDYTLQDQRVEALAVSVLAEIEVDEAGEILRVWKDTFGMDLDRDRVTRHLEDLRRWQSRWTCGGEANGSERK